jgi:hypothetical protein
VTMAVLLLCIIDSYRSWYALATGTAAGTAIALNAAIAIGGIVAVSAGGLPIVLCHHLQQLLL